MMFLALFVRNDPYSCVVKSSILPFGNSPFIIHHSPVAAKGYKISRMVPCDNEGVTGIFLQKSLILLFMPIHVHILTASKDMKLYATQLKAVAKSTIVAVKKSLPIKDVDIVFYDNPEATIDEIGGIGGFTPNAHCIFISLNPRHPNFRRALKNELFFTLAHEFHHTIRWQKQVEGDTLLEALVFEGLADHFAMEVTGRQEPSVYSRALTPEQGEIFLKKAKKEWEKPTYNNAAWFYGSLPEVIPRWAGYTLGYDLVAMYLKAHPKVLPSELACADASLFMT